MEKRFRNKFKSTVETGRRFSIQEASIEPFLFMAKKTVKKSQTKGSKTTLIISVGIILSLVGCYFLIPAFHSGINEAFDVLTSDDQDRIHNWVKQFGAWGPIIIILSMTAQMFALVIPNLLLFIIAIVCYGPVWGGLICLTGVFISSSLGYLIGRKLGPRAIDRFVSENAQKKIQVFVERYGAKAIAIARLSSFSSDGISFVAGILEMEYKKYILATLTGIIPLIVVLAIYGNSGNVERGLLWIAGVSLLSLIVYILIDKRKRRAIYEKRDIRVKHALK
jgi:uncharacterized membrane protein YdjX (TVP38/TMEM64 family)